jgi:vanZ/RDD domain protein
MGYLISIKVAMLVFPALAFFITLPYMIINYRKYGSINKLRTLIVYSFILYLLAVYLLVILPLPNRDSIHNSYKDMLNLIPFSFIMDFIKDNPFVVSMPATWLKALKHPTFYVPAFNVLMLIPFGVYLRYYFKCSFKKTLLLTALLSLFFELTQFSGLYFIYPGPYRLADIDDIIQNTAGGCIGYAFGGLAMHFLPSREEIDEKALQAGLRVSSIRVCLSLIIDVWIVNIPYAISKTPLPFWIFLTLYFSLLPLLNGKTLGSALLKFAIEFENLRWIRTILRGGLLMGYFYLIPSGLMYLMNEFNKDAESILFPWLLPITFLILMVFAVVTVVSVLFNRPFLFDRLSGTIYKSTVKIRK